MPIPSMHDVLAGNQQAAINQLRETIEENKYQEYKRFAETLFDDMDSVTLLAAALKIITKEPDATPVRLTAVEPLSSKKPQFDRKRRSNNDRGGGGGGRNNDRSRASSSRDRDRRKRIVNLSKKSLTSICGDE